MVSNLNYTIADYSHETSVAGFYTADDISAGGKSALQTAVTDITRGIVQAQTFSTRGNISGAYPTDPEAHRELKLLVGFDDNVTGKKYVMTIPCPDISTLTMQEGTDFVVLADLGVMAALVTAMEANAKSEVGNAITVNYGKIVGRNN